MGRHSKAVKLVGGVRGGLALLDDDECRRAIEAGERDIDDGGGFFRGMARPGTALMVAYVDEFRDRFRVGIGRGRVTSVVREPGIRGVRRGGMPVTARPARGAGGGPGLAERGFEAGRRTRLAGPRATGHRDGPKPGIMRAKRRKPPHYKSGTKNRPYQCARRHVRITPRSVMRPGGQRLPAYSSWSIAPENTRFTAGRTTFSDGVRQEFS